MVLDVMLDFHNFMNMSNLFTNVSGFVSAKHLPQTTALLIIGFASNDKIISAQQAPYHICRYRNFIKNWHKSR